MEGHKKDKKFDLYKVKKEKRELQKKLPAKESKNKFFSISKKVFFILFSFTLVSLLVGDYIFIIFGSEMPHITVLIIMGVIWSVATSIWFKYYLSDPIKKLHKGTELISQGNLDYKLKIKTGDEIEKLAESFNRMTESLKDYYSDLEKAVAERTKELENTKNNLEKTNRGLEKFNKLMVGRELRMKELKKEIQELRK